jgi:aminoglycoside phosphotransferase (APT) family kinase protein
MLGRKQTVRELDPPAPPFPAVLSYLWQWFCDLSAGITPNGMTPPTISWEAAAAWASLTGINPQPWEYRAMIALGAMRANIINEGLRQKYAADRQDQPGRKGHDRKHPR